MNEMNKKSQEEKYKEYLDGLNIADLNKKIINFENQNLANFTDEEIINLFLFTISNDGQPIFDVCTQTITKKDTFFLYRIRKIHNDLELDEKWFREPPNNPNGRFNFTNKPVLYASFSQAAIMCETQLKAEESYVEIVYKNKETIKLISIGNINFKQRKINKRKLTPLQYKKSEIINSFVCRQLTRNENDKIFTHKLAQIISKCIYYDFINDVDGVLYPSVSSISTYDYNVAIFNSEKLLTIYYAIVYKNKSSKDKFGIYFEKDKPVNLDNIEGTQKLVKEREKEVNDWHRKLKFDQIDRDLLR